MARKYKINDKIFDLAGLKQHFPYGLHDFMHRETGNLFESYSYKEKKFTDIDNNHGWKLHTDLRRTMSLEESASQIGLKPTDWNQEKYFNFEVFDQDKFDSFVDKFVKLTGGQPTPTNANATTLGRLFFDQPRDMARAVTKNYVNPLHILDVVATAGEHDIRYKTDFKYGAGRMFTFYGQSLEERDRIISTLESKVGNLLEDQNDPDYLKKITDIDTLRKNTPVSKNFTARFTTDYLNIDYADSSGKPFLGINAYSSDRTLDKLQGKVQLDLSASKAIKDKYVVTGIFDPKNIDQQKQALLNLSTDFPEMQEALHGSAGYVSPYRTINDIIEYRMPGSAGINVPGSVAVSSPASAPVITKTIDMANPQRSTLKLNSKVFHTAKTIDLNYEPKIGLSVFEVWPGAMHPGTPINNLVDVRGKSTQEIIDTVNSLDSRAAVNIPNVVEKEIKLGNISHIFTTDPTKSGGFEFLSEPEQENIINNTKGSVYFRNKEGKTARWKLPEISSGDSGWNANKGHNIFSDQAVYLPSEDVMSLNSAEATAKHVTRGRWAAEDVDPRFLSESVINDIVAGKKQTIGYGGVLDVDVGGAVKGAITQPTASTASSATTPVKVGKPTNSLTTVPSRINKPTVNKSATVSPPKLATDRPIINTGTKVTNTVAVSPASTVAPVTAKVANTVAAPPSSTVEPVTAKIANTVAAVPSPSASAAAVNVVNNIASTGAPTKGGSLISSAMEASERVTKGGNLKMVGLGALLGLGAFGLASSRRTNQDNIDRRLEMQRRGMGY